MTKTRWLSASEQRAWRNLIDGYGMLGHKLEKSLRKHSGIGMSEYEVLVRLSEQPEHTMRMAQLATDTVMSRSRLTHVVTRMEERGYVHRSSSAQDARGVECSMTPEGHELLKAAAPQHVTDVRENLIDLLTPEQIQALRTAFTAVAKHIRDNP